MAWLTCFSLEYELDDDDDDGTRDSVTPQPHCSGTTTSALGVKDKLWVHERAKFNVSTAALRNDFGQAVHISMVYLWSISLSMASLVAIGVARECSGYRCTPPGRRKNLGRNL